MGKGFSIEIPLEPDNCGNSQELKFSCGTTQRLSPKTKLNAGSRPAHNHKKMVSMTDKDKIKDLISKLDKCNGEKIVLTINERVLKGRVEIFSNALRLAVKNMTECPSDIVPISRCKDCKNKEHLADCNYHSFYFKAFGAYVKRDNDISN